MRQLIKIVTAKSELLFAGERGLDIVIIMNTREVGIIGGGGWTGLIRNVR